ncbi:MAG: hypothetical protein R2825_03210 [Saprospiraceae bacterium]
MMNVRYHKSKDGGKTFEAKNAPHGDHHDLWIAPENPQRMIIGDDGGAQVAAMMVGRRGRLITTSQQLSFTG